VEDAIMKTKYLLFLLLAILLVAGCAGGPEPEPEQPVEEEPTEEAPPVEEEEPTPSPPDELLADAQELREQIEEYDLAQYAPARYEEGEERYAAGEEAYLNEEYPKAEAELTFAVEAYEQVFEEGMGIIVGDTREEAASAREAAREAKAHVALRQSYSSVERRFNQGDQALEDEEFVVALTAFQEVIPQYQDLRERAIQRRQEAQQALQRAQESLQRTEQQRQELESEAAQDLEDAAGEEVVE
jgi:hypothetical protein